MIKLKDILKEDVATDLLKLNGIRFQIGSGTEGNLNPDRKWILDKFEEMIFFYFLDSDFKFNYTNDSNEYVKIFKNEISNPFMKNLKKFINDYTITKKDFSGHPVITIKPNFNSETWVDNYFVKSKKLSQQLKKEYYEYRKEYAGKEIKGLIIKEYYD